MKETGARLTPGRWAATIAALAAACVAVAAVCCLFGEERLTMAALIERAGPEWTILFRIRLPRVLLGAVVGASLAGAGVAFQALLRNPLADPFILGVSGGAALGATIALVAGAGAGILGTSAVQASSFAGAMLATLLIYSISRTAGRLPPHTVLLAGVVFNAFAAALILFLRSVTSPSKIQEILFWITGYLPALDYRRLAAVAAVACAGLLALFLMSAKMNAMTLGEEGAALLGVEVERLRVAVFFASSLVVASVVCHSGLIGFVGLVVPHAVRMIAGADHRLLLPASCLAGASFLMLSDLAARAAFPALHSLPPAGVVTAFVGAPFFLFLLWRRRGGKVF